MHIKFISYSHRTVVTKRVLISKDSFAREPDENMDMLFHPKYGEHYGFTLRGKEYNASKEKVDTESKICGHKTEAEKKAWLHGIMQAERHIWQEYVDGNVYAILVKEWNSSKQSFVTTDIAAELYGWEDVVEALKDMDLTGVEEFCVMDACGNPDDWAPDKREMDIDEA